MANEFPVEDALAHLRQLRELGMVEQAEDFCQQLVRGRPSEHRFWSWLGVLAMQRGEMNTAESAFRQTVSLEPHRAKYWSDLGFVLVKKDRFTEAESCFQRAIQLEPANATSRGNLATCLMNQQKWPEAADALRELAKFEPQDSAVWQSIAEVEAQRGNDESAKAAYERSIGLGPTPEAALGYSAVLVRLNEVPLAIQILKQVVEQAPSARAWQMFGDALSLVGDDGMAEAAYRQALELDPQSRSALYNLGLALRAQHKLDGAEDYAFRLIERDARDDQAWELLASTQLVQGRAKEAIESAARAVRLAEDSAGYGRFLLAAKQYIDHVAPEELLADHRKWNEQYAKPVSQAFVPLFPTSVGHKRLRIGLLSADFGQHPIAFLALPALRCIDKSKCEIFGYSDRTDEDAYTADFRAVASQWREVARLEDQQLADTIRIDEIDVLVDLMGHTGRRMLVFARNPAPVQVTWLGYVGTTGLSAMQYLLADRFHVRPDEELWYGERVLRMPSCYACYAPPVYMPAEGPLPALSAGHVTFGSLNNPAKFQPQVLAAWAEILQRVPNSRLLVQIGDSDNPRTHARFRATFERHGISGERIVIGGRASHEPFLATYQQIDVALDTQPYSGGLTTCEALWMGVPVITFPGKTFAGRHSFSYLSNIGLEQFVASDWNSYINMAVQSAQRAEELAAIRAELRGRMRSSPLCQYESFAEQLLHLLTEAKRKTF